MSPSPLDIVPQEVLEHIAFFAASADPIGPPADLVPLLLANRRLAAALSSASNPHLHARIFAAKFDARAPLRRLGPRATAPAQLAADLRRRFVLLQRIRMHVGCFVHPTSAAADPDDPETHQLVSEMLWTVYVMMLENDGRNERQLREYAHMDAWLRDYWFDPSGASGARIAIASNQWPRNTELSAVAMWLFWFLLRPEDYFLDELNFPSVMSTLKIIALAAHKYPICQPSWTPYVPRRPPPHHTHPVPTQSHGAYPPLAPPPLAAPAILAYLALAPNHRPHAPRTLLTPHASPLPPSAISADLPMSAEWDSEWHRCLALAGAPPDAAADADPPARAFKLGSLEGVWEGLFTAGYTDFTAYAALLSGAAPPTLHQSVVARHPQTWKLREYHLLAPEPSAHAPRRRNSHADAGNGGDVGENEGEGEGEGDGKGDGEGGDDDAYRPLSIGDPLRAFFPPGVDIQLTGDAALVREPTRAGVSRYEAARAHGGGHGGGAAGDADADAEEEKEYARRVREVLVVGEVSAPASSRVRVRVVLTGHSSWGVFNLLGRIRPDDGFISISKEYVDGDRGRWLYRGYLVGDRHGNLVGRWRDTLSPIGVAGYEGCFFMGRRGAGAGAGAGGGGDAGGGRWERR
ncbi:hypothetical protein HETIRDRAFT_453021 [Heterobasidion irregulare TC 32-1]|uniref:Uncharacterized protein n=1 Tax=Heterobasidion irregulare (strain TC 32-1) TaxID=747525 RepID=W4K4N2_HETIT|nr:uncharacterized protein HETIRDRAFT_453021 [Heterobasidion irregulare TC 32-1]ETW80016.1 hypothetical protein HETIRDRAFT_453021 [Heterobasidion irregulare TC 32-1]